MNVTEQRLETARSVFMAHRKDCKQCRQYKFVTDDLKHLCFRGTTLFKDMLNMEDEIIKRLAAADKAAYTRAEKRRVRDLLAYYDATNRAKYFSGVLRKWRAEAGDGQG